MRIVRVPHACMGTRVSLLVAFLFIVIFATTQTVWGIQVIQVPGDQPTIQAGIDAATILDTVLVAHGTYYENLNMKGKIIVLTSLFAYDHDPAHIATTIIDGSASASADTGSCILMVNGEGFLTVVQGFTLTGGTGTVWVDPHGAGTYREGGGILCEGSSPTIQYNWIIDNEAILVTPGLVSAGGGGIRVGDGDPQILNNFISNNRGRYGAGVVLNYTGVTMRNNVITNNVGGEDFSGSGVWAFANHPSGNFKIVENNTIMGNVSVLPGGGVYVWSTSMIFNNNIVWGNQAPASPQIRTTGATVTTSYSDVEGGYAGTGNINMDPMVAGAYAHLRAGSPCIDAGDPSASHNDPEDSGNPGNALWPSNGTLHNDIGAYGGPGRLLIDATATFEGTPQIGPAPLSVDFTPIVPPGTAWLWDFDDGDSSTLETPTHEFGAGLYDVGLSMTTTAGTEASSVQPAFVTALAETLSMADTTSEPSTQIVWEIDLHNHVPVTEVILPIRLTNIPTVATLDSVSRVGTRTDYFEFQQSPFNNIFFGEIVVRLNRGTGGAPPPPLPPGDGPIARLYLTVKPGATDGQTVEFKLDTLDVYALRATTLTTNFYPEGDTATLTVNVSCQCDCHGDPICDTIVDVFDVIEAVDVAFRSGPPRIDPNAGCPRDMTDIDCSAITDVFDVVGFVDVAFRSADPAAVFCDPCAP